MTEAHYLHTSLYSFSADSRKEIISRFNEAVNDASARCWYDPIDDAFEMKCPVPLGPNADAALVDVIATYIEEEIKNADRDDREPNIERFRHSRFDDVFTEARLQPRADSANGGQLGVAPKAVMWHDINVEKAGSDVALKFFRLSEMPAALHHRTLGSKFSMNDNKAVKTGLTLRAVRFGEGEVSFNGRIGEALPNVSGDVEADLLDTAPFQTIVALAQYDTPADTLEATHWRFRGDQPSVDQWLAGMGDPVELVDPESTAEMPRETRTMLIAEQLHLPPSAGRPRVAQNVPVALGGGKIDEESDEQPAPNRRSAQNDFQRLLRGHGSDPDESDSEKSASTTKESNPEPTFSELLRSGRTPQQTPSSEVCGLPGSMGPKPARVSPALRAVIDNDHPLSMPQKSKQDGEYPIASAGSVAQPSSSSSSNHARRLLQLESDQSTTYGSAGRSRGRFATVDNVGLSANAADLARWEMENAPQFQLLGSILGSVSASRSQAHVPFLKSGSVAMSESTGRELNQDYGWAPAQGSEVTTLYPSIHSYAETPPITESWATNIVPNVPTDGMLVDSTASGAGGMVEPLPGYYPALPPAPAPAPAARLPIARDMYNAGRAPSLKKENALINISDVTTNATASIQRNPRQRRLSVMRPMRRPDAIHIGNGRQPSAAEADDEVHERLHVEPGDQRKKQYTMRQKAPPKRQGASVSRGNRFGIFLDKPDPLPLAGNSRKAKDKGDAKPLASDSSPIKQPKPANISSESKQEHSSAKDKAKHPNGEKEKLTTNIEKILNLATEHKQCVLRIDLGLILLKSFEDKGLRQAVVCPLNLQKKLETFEEAAFMPRLTTSISDGHFILELVKGDLSARALYVFSVRDQDGNLHEMEVLSGSSDDAEVTCVDELAVLDIHFPFRVWDAKAVVTSTAWSSGKEFPKDVLRQFVNSIHTINEAPSFAVKAPKNTFTVEKVFAKREYTRQIDVGRLIVTEVQDLIVHSVNGAQANLKATCDSREAMIDAQRYWWEVAMHVDNQFDNPLVDADSVQEAVDTLVVQMDGVGFGNVGPWRRRAEESSGQRSVANTAIPFW